MRHVQIGVFLAVVLAGCQAKPPNTPKGRFLELVRNKFQADSKEIESAFRDCFQRGQMLVDYEDVLSTAGKSVNKETGVVTFHWLPDKKEEGEIYLLTVETSGDPPYVLHAWEMRPWN